jgi:hypothetical protein
MPEAMVHGIRRGQSPQDKEVGAARTQVFHQSEFYKTHFLNNPNLERAFDPGRNTLKKRRLAETGSIPDATLRAMDVAGNVVRARQGRAPTTDPRIGENIPITASPANRKPLYFGGVPSSYQDSAFAAGFADIAAASITTTPTSAIKKKKKKAPAQTSARRSALLFDQSDGGLG